jgi:hypothetical protein
LIITCLWRSLYFLSVGPTLGIAAVRRLRGLLTTLGSPHAKICRVCPSIFNCQRPQMLQPNCKFGEAKGKKIGHQEAQKSFVPFRG